MDTFACSIVLRTIFFIILYSDISSQPLYENQREDPITPNRTEHYYQKVYGKPETNHNILLFWVAIYCADHRVYFDIDEPMLVHEVYQSLAHIVAIRNHTWMQMYACVLVWGLWLLKCLYALFVCFWSTPLHLMTMAT